MTDTVDISKEATEHAAKVIYDAMIWAYEDGSGNRGPAWVEGGNSKAQDKARDAAQAAIAAMPARTVTPQEAAKVLLAVESQSLIYDACETAKCKAYKFDYVLRALSSEQPIAQEDGQ